MSELARRRPQLLSPSLRQPFLQERQDDWREGIAAVFVHFGGVPATILGDNARALVLGRDRATGTVHFHPAYLAFFDSTCRKLHRFLGRPQR